MSFLTPLYLAGLAAIGLPILFHLIRRMPRGRVPFSSIMFLSPSPPRLTRKNRLENVLLLLLRALALAVLAAAFARPFIRELAHVAFEEARRRHVAILLDTSASMRRGNLWEQAVATVEAALDEIGPDDDAALFTFTGDVKIQVPFNEVSPRVPAQHIARVRARLADLGPTWGASNLGAALIAVADELNDVGDRAAGGTTREIVLVGDLAAGSSLDALGGYAWPDDVRIQVRAVGLPEGTNAGLHLVPTLPERGDGALRVRVTNDRESGREEFGLTWVDGGGTAVGKAVSAYVPPGESRIFGMALPDAAGEAYRLVLTGDDHAFDNTLHVAPIRQEEVPVIYIGSDGTADAAGLRYYLERALPETAARKIRVVACRPDEPWRTPDGRVARLIIVGEAVPGERIGELRSLMEGGRTVLLVLKSAAAGATLGGLMDRDGLDVKEARSATDYAMLGEIAFTHPLFAPFNDPRYNDFTKIHFWNYRRVELDGIPGVTILARFEIGDPALFEQPVGRGRLLVLTSGWHPADSQLARSSKFVPLLFGILEESGVAGGGSRQYLIGDSVGRNPADPAGGSVRKPDGSDVELAAGARTFSETDAPGVYELRLADATGRFAVNIDPAESRTAALDEADLERFGLLLGAEPPPSEAAKEKERQMREAELEHSQKLWRWLIVAALGILFIETLLAGYAARSQAELQGDTE